jgi:hypothetical protein
MEDFDAPKEVVARFQTIIDDVRRGALSTIMP